MAEPTTPCGCCAGVDSETPARIDNLPGQPAIAYRIGRHPQFLESLLARLSSGAFPALAGLQRRDGADISIALCDALATSLDVLTFHSERIANESPLRTATELRSLQELARLIGYRPAPGVAASTWLAFNLQEAPADPSLSAEPVPIPVGTRVQSVPGPGEEAQTFETIAPIVARTEWNAAPVETEEPWQPRPGDRSLWLSGLGLRLAVGDAIVIVAPERLTTPTSRLWALRLLTTVREDRDQQRTQVFWATGLSELSPAGQAGPAGCTVFVFRQRAGLFGHNAPDPNLLPNRVNPLNNIDQLTQIKNESGKKDFEVSKVAQQKYNMRDAHEIDDAPLPDWPDLTIKYNQIDLEAAYKEITPDSWLALVSNEQVRHGSGLRGEVELFRASSVAFPSRSAFAISARITRIEPDTSNEQLNPFRNRLRQTLVLAQSEPLAVAARPLLGPLFGEELVLARRQEGLEAGHVVVVRGKAPRLRLRARPAGQLATGDGPLPLREGDCLRLLAPPERLEGGAAQALNPAEFEQLLATPGMANLRLRLQDRGGSEGILEVGAAAIELLPPEANDPLLQEVAVLQAPLASGAHDRAHSPFRLAKALRQVYDRRSVRVNLNVAAAGHGETVSEVLGSGNARQRNQRFPLRQGPLTHVPSSASPSGRRSTLELRVNDLLWEEVPSLFARGPGERVYALEADARQGSSVLSGDGVEGSVLPTGDTNVRATYRKGLGAAGNVAAGRLTTLLSRPLGVSEVVNPEAAVGGEDPEPLERLRQRAPLTVRSLDRTVSLRDYRDFARAFAGIAKADALWIPHGPARGVLLTLAGEHGQPLDSTLPPFTNLLAALRRYGDPLLPLRLRSFEPSQGLFRLRLRLKVAADAEPTRVKAAVAAALREAFSFERRDFRQPVWIDEVAAVVQAVAGVEAFLVTALHRSGAPVSREPRLLPWPQLRPGNPLPQPAELLRLDPAGLVLEELP